MHLPVNQLLPFRRRLLAAFLAVTIVPLALLVWLTCRIINQEHALERQTARDRLEGSADVIVASMQRDLGQLEDELTHGGAVGDTSAGGDAVVASFSADHVTARSPSRLLFYPGTLKSDLEPRNVVFQAGEALEFRDNDYSRAATEFRRLERSDDRAVRAAALVRLARVLYKGHEPDQSLATYAELARLGDVSVDGTPAELIARDARCSLLAELGRTAELHREAASLDADLARARWRLDRSTYLFHAYRARRWLKTAVPVVDGRDTSLALASAVERLWDDWQRSRRSDSASSGRQTAWINQIPITLIWRSWPDSLMALVAGPRFMLRRLQRGWSVSGASVSLWDAEGHRVFGGRASTQGELVTRSAQDTRLPWTLRVSAATSAEVSELAGRRRRLLLGGLALTALLTITGAMFTIRATARELAVAKLESDFVAAVSHEFRTPLTSLRHLTDLLESGAILSEERRQLYYATMARETERLHRMVEGLLDFGRTEAGRREYSFEPADPIQLVESVIEEFQADIATTGRRIESTVGRLPPSGRLVRVDREAISHAIRNLIDNAVKYSPEPSPVWVELDDSGKRVSIRVRDQGIGIAAGEQASIFEKFVRGSASRSLNVKGSGIGLAMSRHIVRAHGGDITVNSGVGRGSTFTILLPGVERENGQAIA